MEATPWGAIIAAIAVITALAEILKLVINHFISKDKDKIVLTDDDIAYIKLTFDMTAKMLDMHIKTDENGTPLWYFPRALANAQNELRLSLNNLAHSQDVMARAIDKLVSTLDNIDRRQATMETLFLNHTNLTKKD